MDDRLHELVQRDPRYPVEAYDFICDALEYTQEWLDRVPLDEDDPDADYHICADELCQGACLRAVREFGMMAMVVFQQWNIRRTNDIGNIVFNLIDIERLYPSERDQPSDFDDIFPLVAFMEDQYSIGQASKREKGGR